MTKPKPTKIKNPKTNRRISDHEFFMIASFLVCQKKQFAIHCDAFEYYDDEDLDNLIKEVAGPEYDETLKIIGKLWKKQN